MNELTEDFFSVNELIDSKLPFAIYRAPGEKHLSILVQNSGNVYTTTDIDDLNGKSGFVIAPFCCNKNTPICIISPDVCETINMDNISSQRSEEVKEQSRISYENNYQKRFALFSEALCVGEFEKLVLSSKFSGLGNSTSIDVEKSFFEACKRYQYSYVYLFYTSATGLWMGSTPEILLSNVGGEWLTVALAGTQSLLKGELPQSWDLKNKTEQNVVSDYIRLLLQEEGISPKESKPYSVKAGKLSHIRTDFRFTMTDTSRLGSLLKRLHPTPAVCGMPKDKAYRFILDHEGYDRKYYSGFIGMINPSGITDLYVNLRCVCLSEEKLALYAGGGLLASSVMQDEWNEIEKKMHTMQDILITK